MIAFRKRHFLFLSYFLFFLFAIFTVFVLNGTFLQLDRYVNNYIPYSSTDVFYFISIVIANLFLPLFVIIILLFVYFLIQKRKDDILLLLASFSGLVASELVFKPIFRIQCPQTYYKSIVDTSAVIIHQFALKETCYPSGHTTSYVVFFGCLAYLAYRYIKRIWLRYAIFIVCGSILILVGPSRLYLHYHWLSDVIAAYFLGFGLLSMIVYLFSKKTEHILK
jgi:membrane-associated phospholipid phosphatase